MGLHNRGAAKGRLDGAAAYRAVVFSWTHDMAAPSSEDYGDHAVTYLERALSESPYAFVRTQSAEELALRGRPIAFRFFLDALENNRFYQQELVGWLKTRFPNEVPASQDDAGVIAFLKSRLQP